MGKQTFKVKFETTAEIELDDELIAAVDDEWRSQFYADLVDAEAIAEHIAFNLVINDSSLRSLDGFADQPSDRARIVSVADWDVWVRP